MIATHRFETAHGDPLWTLRGHDRFRVEHDGSTWRIRAITMTATWTTGNQHITTLAAAG